MSRATLLLVCTVFAACYGQKAWQLMESDQDALCNGKHSLKSLLDPGKRIHACKYRNGKATKCTLRCIGDTLSDAQEDKFVCKKRRSWVDMTRPDIKCQYPLCSSEELTYCNGECFDLQNTTAHCGTCGNVCKLTDSCQAGTCVSPYQDYAESIYAPHDLTSSSFLGWAVAASGQMLAVSADGWGAEGTGRVYIFVWNMALRMYNMTQAIDCPDETESSTYFGWAVALSGDWLVIGAPIMNPSGAERAGSAFVYKADVSGTFQLQQRFDGTESSEYLGQSVAISASGVLALGSPYGDVGSASDAGFVGIYALNETGSFVLSNNMTMPQPASSDSLGSDTPSLSMTSDYIACGAPYSEGLVAGDDHGNVVIYKRDEISHTWSRLQVLTGSDVGEEDNFGNSVVLHERADGTVQMAVGAPYDEDSADGTYNSGTVYMFEVGEDGLFSERQLIRVEDSDAEYFGTRSAFSPDGMHMLISAPATDVNATTGATLEDAGAMYMYALDVDGWSLERRIVSEDPIDGDEFGAGVVWSEYAYIAGSTYNGDLASNAGRLHFFNE